MHTISIRLDEETYNAIEERRGLDNRSEFCRKLINDALITSINKSIPNDDKGIPNDDKILQVKVEDLEERIKDLQSLINSKNDLILNIEKQKTTDEQVIEVLEGRVKDLQTQNGFLIQEHTYQKNLNERLLMPSQEERKEKPRWFEFWKK
jgi:metal-responsive CopG/Arc/MetJ family transcriptional regulator